MKLLELRGAPLNSELATKRKDAQQRLELLPRLAWTESAEDIQRAFERETDQATRASLSKLLPKLSVSDLSKIQLGSLLQDADVGMRSAAVGAASRLDFVELQPLANVLIKLLDDSEMKYSAPKIVEALGKLSDQDELAAARLVKFASEVAAELIDPNVAANSKRSGFNALYWLPPQMLAGHAEALAAIDAELDDGEARTMAACSLLRLEPEALIPFVPKLRMLLEQCMQVGVDIFTPLLVVLRLPSEVRKDLNGVIKDAFDGVLGGEAMLFLTPAVTNPDHLVAILRFLRHLPSAELARLAPTVAALLEDPGWRVKSQAIKTLAKLEPSMLEAYVDTLTQCVSKDDDPRVQREALAALEQLNETREQAQSVVKAMETARERVLQGRFACGYDDPDREWWGWNLSRRYW